MFKCDDRVDWKGNLGTVMWSNPDETQVNWDANSLRGIFKTSKLTKALPTTTEGMTTGELRALIEQLNIALYARLIKSKE